MNDDKYPTKDQIKQMHRFFECKYDKVLHPWQQDKEKASRGYK